MPLSRFIRLVGVITNPPVVIVRNATIWTSGPQGKLEKADLLVEAVGAARRDPDVGKLMHKNVSHRETEFALLIHEAQRTGEIGLRRALGAHDRAVVAMVARRSAIEGITAPARRRSLP
mgnify:CR=1 FL=1